MDNHSIYDNIIYCRIYDIYYDVSFLLIILPYYGIVKRKKVTLGYFTEHTNQENQNLLH